MDRLRDMQRSTDFRQTLTDLDNAKYFIEDIEAGSRPRSIDNSLYTAKELTLDAWVFTFFRTKANEKIFLDGIATCLENGTLEGSGTRFGQLTNKLRLLYDDKVLSKNVVSDSLASIPATTNEIAVDLLYLTCNSFDECKKMMGHARKIAENMIKRSGENDDVKSILLKACDKRQKMFESNLY